NHPGFLSGTSHLTQVVRRNNRQIVCVIANCRGGTIFPQASKYSFVMILKEMVLTNSRKCDLLFVPEMPI
ncbi:hypothetical protein M422DRAFT_183445, partial [Sphaerobolus stellatus SS14]